MAMMFKIALQRLADGEHGQVMPITLKSNDPDGAPRTITAYELQWLERQSIDLEDFIVCKYRVRDPDDVKQVETAIKRKADLQALARTYANQK